MISYPEVAQELRQKIGGIARANEPMSRHTSFGVGGPVDLYTEPANVEDIAVLLAESARLGIPWMTIGDGQNLLVSDLGIRGMVIRIGKPMGYIKVDGTTVVAGAGAKLAKTIDTAVANSLAGLEGTTGVPGSIGGAILMNAGTRYGYIGEVTQRVRVVNSDGSVQDLAHDEIGFGYRSCALQGGGRIVAEAEFNLTLGDKEELVRMVEHLRHRRTITQPNVGRSAGCMFKNPPDQHASLLIDQAGAKGMRVGDAEVSDKHANFLLNMGNASAEQILALAERVREMVHGKFGILLDYEVRIVGDWRKVE